MQFKRNPLAANLRPAKFSGVQVSPVQAFLDGQFKTSRP